MSKLNNGLTQLRYLPGALKLVWTAGKGWTIAWCLLLILQSVLPVLTVYLTRELVNRVADVVRVDWQPAALQAALLVAAALVIVQVATTLLSSLNNWVRTVQSELFRDYISGLIYEKATALDLSFYETPEYYDLLHRVRSDARQAPLILLENLGALATSGLTLIGMMGLLAAYSLWLPFVLILGALPALYVVLRYSRYYNRWRLKNTSSERLSSYYDFVLTERSSAAELRLFALGKYYRDAYQTLRTRLRSERLKLGRDKLLTDLIATGIALLVAGAVLIWMGQRVLQRLATLGDLVAFYQIFQQGQSLMQSVMQNAGSIYQSILFLQDLFDFFALEPRLKTKEAASQRLPLHKGIRFDKVSFRYPGSEKYALKDFSLNIEAGKIVALVGENGTGKTTLMKLLCRFYDPSDGRILWDDVDLRDLPLETLRREITMMFQNTYYYQESARHNIAVGDLAANPSLETIQTAARAAGADDVIRRLPQGYETILGKWFGGEELSSGQWQRVALARAIVREASLIILDEPTSAMDAWAEMDWLARMREVANGRTLIMITHRFTTAMQADHIYVMHDNQIIEEGTHESLLEQGKRYAESWSDQMRDRTADK